MTKLWFLQIKLINKKNCVVPIAISKTIIFPWIMRAISVIASSLVVYQPFHVIISLIWVIVRCSGVSDWWLILSSNSVFRGIDTLWVIFWENWIKSDYLENDATFVRYSDGNPNLAKTIINDVITINESVMSDSQKNWCYWKSSL